MSEGVIELNGRVIAGVGEYPDGREFKYLGIAVKDSRHQWRESYVIENDGAADALADALTDGELTRLRERLNNAETIAAAVSFKLIDALTGIVIAAEQLSADDDIFDSIKVLEDAIDELDKILPDNNEEQA